MDVSKMQSVKLMALSCVLLIAATRAQKVPPTPGELDAFLRVRDATCTVTHWFKSSGQRKFHFTHRMLESRGWRIVKIFGQVAVLGHSLCVEKWQTCGLSPCSSKQPRLIWTLEQPASLVKH